MLRIPLSEVNRIKKALDSVFEHQLTHNEYSLALKALGIAMCDAWITGHEYKWEKRRQKLNKYINNRYNFENNVRNDLREL